MDAYATGRGRFPAASAAAVRRFGFKAQALLSRRDNRVAEETSGDWWLVGTMCAAGGMLAGVAPYTIHPVLTDALGLMPLFILAHLGCPLPAMAGGLVWGVAALAASTLLGIRSFGTGAESCGPVGLLAMSALLVGPALFACVGAHLTRRFGYSVYVLGVWWYAVVVACSFCGADLTTGAQGSLSSGTVGSAIVSALGYTSLALVTSWLSAAAIRTLVQIIRWAQCFPLRRLRFSISKRPARRFPGHSYHWVTYLLNLAARAPPSSATP